MGNESTHEHGRPTVEIEQAEISSYNIHLEVRRKVGRKGPFVGLFLGLIGSFYYAHDSLIGSRYVTSESAHVGAEIAHVTSLTGGGTSSRLR